VRLFLTNTANVRPFRLSIPGARMKLVGADGGRVEREAFIEDIVISPSERAVVDVLFETAGEAPLEHRAPGSEHRLATFRVLDGAFDAARVAEFEQLRTNAEYVPERSALAAELDRDPDRRLQLVAVMPGMRQQGGGHGHADIEWEDTMALHNRMTNPRNMFWKLVDQDTGAENQAIRWAFREGDRIKLRIENTPHSDHPMQHPFHVHGQRFLVIARNGSSPESLAWKDTVLIPTGETVDLLIEMANPGTWMAHCHIAEHLEAGMMLSFAVDEGSADR
jgi:FtsP/CotA-like multicopper oxidase with cupredoxin domain